MTRKFNFILKKLTICWGIIFFYPFSFLSAQRTDIVSLETQYHNTPALNSAIDLSKAYQQQADWFQHTPQFNIDSANFYFDKAIVLLENTKPLPSENLAEVYKNKSAFYYHAYKHQEAGETAAKAGYYFEQISKEGKKNVQLQYDILMIRSFAEVDDKNPKFGLELFSKAIALFQENTAFVCGRHHPLF